VSGCGRWEVRVRGGGPAVVPPEREPQRAPWPGRISHGHEHRAKDGPGLAAQQLGLSLSSLETLYGG
jgi:hypothetical protein